MARGDGRLELPQPERHLVNVNQETIQAEGESAQEWDEGGDVGEGAEERQDPYG